MNDNIEAKNSVDWKEGTIIYKLVMKLISHIF